MSQQGSASGGLDPHRVAEVLVELPARPGRRGSGYRVSDSIVLTAAHVVRNAARVRVRFDADSLNEWVTEVIEWPSEAAADVALLTIAPPPGQHGVEPARFGRVGERDAVLSYSAMGFPWFKLRNDPAQASDDGSPSRAWPRRDNQHT